jgi:hypothetical protein
MICVMRWNYLHKPLVFHGNELGQCVPNSWKENGANNFKYDYYMQNNSEIWKFITCWSHGLIVKLTVGLHTYQAANNIYEQSLGYLDHVHNIHESFLHYQPDWWGKDKTYQKSDMSLITHSIIRINNNKNYGKEILSYIIIIIL